MAGRQGITQKVVEYFIKEIEEGRWAVGDKIPSEKELYTTLGTSRSSVRAAIQQFIGIGAMESVHGKGTYLRSNDLSSLGNKGNGKEYKNPFDYGSMGSLLEFRLIIETEAAYYAAKRMTDEHLGNLRIYLEKMQAAVNANNSKTFVHYDMCFHLEIAYSTGNPFIIDSLQNAFVEKADYFYTLNENYGYIDGIYYHTLLVKAIEMKDATKARRTMRNHLQKVLDDIFYEETIIE